MSAVNLNSFYVTNHLINCGVGLKKIATDFTHTPDTIAQVMNLRGSWIERFPHPEYRQWLVRLPWLLSNRLGSLIRTYGDIDEARIIQVSESYFQCVRVGDRDNPPLSSEEISTVRQLRERHPDRRYALPWGCFVQHALGIQSACPRESKAAVDTTMELRRFDHFLTPFFPSERQRRDIALSTAEYLAWLEVHNPLDLSQHIPNDRFRYH